MVCGVQGRLTLDNEQVPRPAPHHVPLVAVAHRLVGRALHVETGVAVCGKFGCAAAEPPGKQRRPLARLLRVVLGKQLHRGLQLHACTAGAEVAEEQVAHRRPYLHRVHGTFG